MTYFKRLTVIMLVVAMILGTAGIAGAAPSDVVGQPCEEAVDYLMDLGIVAGYPDGTFQPARTLTRAEVAKIIVLAHLGAQGETLAGYLKGAYSFSDVPATHWASGYIKLAQNLGIVDGYPDNTFRPLQAVTHIELVKMLLEAANVAPGAGTWPTNYLTPGLAEGIVVEGLGVNEPITRCDMAEMTAHTIANVVNPITGKTLAQSVFGESMVATLTVAPAASTVAIGAAVQFVATAKDAAGAIVSDVGIEFTTSDPAKSAINTAGLFVASASGHYTVTATIGTVEAEAMVHVFGAATALMATPETATAPANGETVITITVKVVDENGITVVSDDDTEITMDYDEDNGAVDIDWEENVQTVENGVATFEVVATDNADVTDTLVFWVDADDDIEEDTVEVTTVDQVATAIELTADPTELMANEIDEGTVTATVVDQAGELMLSGVYELTFSITGKGTLEGATKNVTMVTSYDAMEEQIQAVVDVASEKGDPGTFTVTATGEGLATASVTVTSYIAGSPVALKVIVDDGTTKAEGSDDLEITVGLVDKWGHWTISDVDTVLEFDYDDKAEFCGCLNGTIPAGESRIDIEFSGYKAGTWTITVTDADDDYTAASFDVTVVAGDPVDIGYEPDQYDETDLWLPITNPTVTFTVQLYDAEGNKVAKADEEIDVVLGGERAAKINGETVDPEETITIETNASGVATVVFEAQKYIAEGDGYWLDFYYGDAHAHMSTIYVTDTVPGSISIATANGEATVSTVAADSWEEITVTVTVKDTNGNAMDKPTDVKITFSNDGDNVQNVTLDGEDDEFTGTTNPDGVLSFTFMGAKAGSFTITAEAVQTLTSVTATKSFRTKIGTEIVDALIFNADGTLADDVDFDDNTPVALKLSLVDNGGNVMVAPEATDVLLVPAEGGEYRETASGTSVSTVTIGAGKTYKTIYFVSDVDGDGVNLSDDAVWPIPD